jgi:AcrR family transcriptional regulator
LPPLVNQNVSSVNIVMKKTASKARARPYHHGDLRPAILSAAEKIVEKEGVDALTLRAVARAVGVSHTAPKNHFGDLQGLLSELAAIGYRRYGEALVDGMNEAGADPRVRMRAMGRAYVGFAREHPGMYLLMFRSERLDMKRLSLREAIEETRRTLRDATASVASAAPLPPLQLAARATASWALAHGFAMLLIDGRLRNTLASLPETNVDMLLEAVLDALRAND